MDKLLKELNIDSSLPLGQILEALQEKNLEYLERLENCGDEGRAQKLREMQKRIEDAVMTCSSSVSLEGRIRKQEKELSDNAKAQTVPVQSAPTEPDRSVAAAVGLYQQGRYDEAIPLLQEHAGDDTLACLLLSKIFLQKNQKDQARRYLYDASKLGDDGAALMLAQQYYQEKNYISAEKWAKDAMNRNVPKSGSLMMHILMDQGKQKEAIEPGIRELQWAKGYDKYAQVKSLCLMIQQLPVKERPKCYGALKAAIKDDPQSLALVKEDSVRTDKQLRADRVRAMGKWMTWILCAAAVGLTYLSRYGYLNLIYVRAKGAFVLVYGLYTVLMFVLNKNSEQRRYGLGQAFFGLAIYGFLPVFAVEWVLDTLGYNMIIPDMIYQHRDAIALLVGAYTARKHI